MIYIGINAGYNAVSLLRKLIMTDTFVCANCGRTMPSSEAEYIEINDDPICADCFDEVYPSGDSFYERLDNFDPAGH